MRASDLRQRRVRFLSRGMWEGIMTDSPPDFFGDENAHEVRKFP